MIDDRLLRVELILNNESRIYENLEIQVSGSKTNNTIQNEFTVKITNLKRDVRESILTQSALGTRQIVKPIIRIFAGRRSYGYSLIFEGDIRKATISQPPDISLTIGALTGNALKIDTTSRTAGALILLSSISEQVAQKLGKQLIFEAQDKQISNYTYTGASLRELENLEESGGVNTFIDNFQLIIKDINKPLRGNTIVVNKNSGMVGIPEITERGVRVKILFSPNAKIGGMLELESELNPAADGRYDIYKTTYDLMNRGQNFYITVEAARI